MCKDRARTRTGPSSSLIALAVFGNGPLFIAVQIATFLILFLAANTSYADFPQAGQLPGSRPLRAAPVHEPRRPAGFLERDHGLGVLACVLIAIYHAELEDHQPLRRRGFHELHPVAARDGSALAQAEGHRTAVAAHRVHQRARRDDNLHRPDHRSDIEVHATAPTSSSPRSRFSSGSSPASTGTTWR